MKNLLYFILPITLSSFSLQEDFVYKTGEVLKYNVSYGLINAGYVDLEVKDEVYKGRKVFHVVGKGYTNSFFTFFYKVDDTYESYIDKQTKNPVRHIRKVYEGGYTKDQEGFLNHAENKALVKDYKHNTETITEITKDTQDLFSSFYYLRNHPDVDKLKVGEAISLDILFDNKVTKFKLTLTGFAKITTEFGDMKTMVFKPSVLSGRVFKGNESVTIWVSTGKHKMPIRLQAKLAVGAVSMELYEYKL